MNKIKALWGRLGPTERMVIAVGIPLVALAALYSSRQSKKKEPEKAPPPGFGSPQVFAGLPGDYDTSPIGRAIDRTAKKIDEVYIPPIPPIPPIVITPVSGPAETPRPPIPTAPATPTDAPFVGTDNNTLIQTANDWLYNEGESGRVLQAADGLAYRIHRGVLSIGDIQFYAAQDVNQPLHIRDLVRRRLALYGWG